MDETVAFLQIEYDTEVHFFGAASFEAIQAENAIKKYLKGKPAPVTLAIQTKENHDIPS